MAQPMTTPTSSPPSRTLRRCGCTPGACSRCAPRGCPCHAFASFHDREPYPAELDALLPSPPERLELPPPTVTYRLEPWTPGPSLGRYVWADEEAAPPPLATQAPPGATSSTPAPIGKPPARKRAPRGAQRPPRARVV